MMVQRMQRGQIGMHHDGAWMQRGSAVFVFVPTGANTGEQEPRRSVRQPWFGQTHLPEPAAGRIASKPQEPRRAHERHFAAVRLKVS